jgi:O-succinylbenzoic acid--CoA ligase
MSRLIAVALPPGDAFVEAVQRAWEAGDAVAPVDWRLPQAARRELLAELAPAEVVDESGTVPMEGGVPVCDGDALVLATSGTTGRPKAAVLTHDSLIASALATSKRLESDPKRDRWLACIPLSHAGGMSVVVRALHTGTPLSVLSSFDPAQVEIKAREGATMVSLVPTALARIDASLFRVILLGGAAPPESLPPNVVTTYGMTETFGGVVYNGVPLEGVSVSVDRDGEILLSSPTLARCYRGNGGKEWKLPMEGSFYRTGDIGELRTGPEGATLTVVGRRDEMIVSGGEKVWPAPLERTLRDHPKVADAAVVGAEDPEWGQRVVAFVVPTRPEDPPVLAELAAWVRETRPPWEAPKELVIVASLPRTSLGKLRRHELGR